MKLDLKIIAILVLIGIVVFQQCGGKKEEGQTIVVDGKKYEVIKHQIDTIEIVKTKTIHKKGKDIYHDTTIYVPLPSTPIDTLSILKNFYAKNIYRDTLFLSDSLGTIVVLDTISQNKIFNRTYHTKVSQRYIKDMMIVKEANRNQVYYGAIMGFDNVNFINAVGGGLILKTKKDKIYQINLGIMNQPGNSSIVPILQGGIFWKIKLKK